MKKAALLTICFAVQLRQTIAAEVKIDREDQKRYCVYDDKIYSIDTVLCKIGKSAYLRCDGVIPDKLDIAHWTVVPDTKSTVSKRRRLAICKGRIEADFWQGCSTL